MSINESQRKEQVEAARNFVGWADRGERTTSVYTDAQALLMTQKLLDAAEAKLAQARASEIAWLTKYQERVRELETHIDGLREALELLKVRVVPQAGFKVYEIIDKALALSSTTPADSRRERLRKLEAVYVEVIHTIPESKRSYRLNKLLSVLGR